METCKINVKREGQKVTLTGPSGIQSRFFDTETQAIECYNHVKNQIDEANKQTIKDAYRKFYGN